MIPARNEPGGVQRGWFCAARGGLLRGASIIDWMVIDMNEAQVRTLEQVRQVLAGTQALEFRRAEDDEDRYAWIEQVLRRLSYRQLGRHDRGAVLAYLQSHSDDVGDSAAIENAADYFTHDFLLARDRFAREVESWREMYPQADLSRIDAILAALK